MRTFSRYTPGAFLDIFSFREIILKIVNGGIFFQALLEFMMHVLFVLSLLVLNFGQTFVCCAALYSLHASSSFKFARKVYVNFNSGNNSPNTTMYLLRNGT